MPRTKMSVLPVHQGHLRQRVNRLWGYVRQHKNDLNSEKVCQHIEAAILTAAEPTMVVIRRRDATIQRQEQTIRELRKSLADVRKELKGVKLQKAF